RSLPYSPVWHCSAKPARTPSPPTATPGGCCPATPPTTPAGSPPSWTWPDLGAPLIGGFPGHLEHHRGNTAPTRNARLAAIHSLFRYAALHCPEHAELTARVLAIPPKRYDKALVTWLTEPEPAALLTSTWCERAVGTMGPCGMWAAWLPQPGHGTAHAAW